MRRLFRFSVDEAGPVLTRRSCPQWFSAVGALVFTPLFGILRDLATDGTGESSSCTSTRCYRPIFALSAVSAALATALVGVLARRWATRTASA